MSIMFNEICINEEMLPKYIYIYIYIYIYYIVSLDIFYSIIWFILWHVNISGSFNAIRSLDMK